MKHWDIFCAVVDNFGDIGVCWRLARQLVAEHGQKVRLWVDDLVSFQRLCPEIDPASATQFCRGIEVAHWSSLPQAFPDTDAADVVIEAFACELPASYLEAMVRRAGCGDGCRPAWINLEYLSAEAWISGCHALPSPHPRLPLVKHFFFPGFTPNSGGLLREANLFTRRDAFRRNLTADAEIIWAQFGLPPPQPDELCISLFCYENPALDGLLSTWTEGDKPIRCLVPEGRVLEHIATGLQPGEIRKQGNLTICARPFVAQEDFDPLLWLCNLNFVRGEDSFVRAQWAARPLVWHIYPQDDDAHIVKLNAFLDIYCGGLAMPTAQALRAFSQKWNQANAKDASLGDAWQKLLQYRSELDRHAAHWASQQAEKENLCANLVYFCQKLL